jgi:hypothetical protein
MEKWQHPKDDNFKFDFTLESNSPEVEKAVALLLQIEEFQTGCKKRHARHLSLIIENLVLAHKQGEEFRISYPRAASFYSRQNFRRDKRKNPKGISRKLLRYIDILCKHQYVHNKNGFYDASNQRNSFLSRMQPAPRFLKEIVVPFGLLDIKLRSGLLRPVIEVKDEEGRLTNEYDTTEPFVTAAARVKAYNDFYDKTDIGIIDNRYNCILAPERKHLYRVFNEGSLEKGGRFYGPWWQQKSEVERQLILIDSEPTVELDYTGAHLGFLYGMTGSPMPPALLADPYSIDDKPRELVKLCVLRAMNNPSPVSAWRSVNRALFEGGNPDLRYDEFETIMEGFFNRHKIIHDMFYTKDLCLTLQYLDSVVADYVLSDLMLQKGIAVLPIHDSFIVRERDQTDLIVTMKDAYSKSNDTRIRNSFTSIKDKKGNIIHYKDSSWPKSGPVPCSKANWLEKGPRSVSPLIERHAEFNKLNNMIQENT